MNRINSAGWEYDAAGDQTRVQVSGGSWQRLEYDAAGRVVRVRDEAGGVLASCTYGATTERLISQEGDVRTYYLWSGSRVITEYTEVGSSTEPVWTKHYVYLGARLLATIHPSGEGNERVEFHHPDRLGTRLVTSSQDGSYYEQVTLPFGVALEAESSGATNRRFTSYDRSSVTGLDYAVNRHYDPQQGRFTQVDPVGAGAASLADPQSWNMYSYCGNDPVNRLDPDGLFWGKLFKWVGKGLKWVGVAALVATAVLAVVGLSSVTFATTTLGKVLKFIADIPVLIGSKVAGLGKTIAGVFSFADAGGVSATVAALIGNGVLLGGNEAAGAIANYLQQRRRQKRRGRGEFSRTGRQFSDRFLFEAVLALMFISQHNEARDAGASDEVILCQVYKESRFNHLARAGSHRGLLQVNPIAAGEAGLGNGQGMGLSDEELATVNPDYINNIYDAAQNIRVGTRYLAIRIKRAGGSLRKGLEGYGTGPGYANNILKCADLIKQGRLAEGLATIYPP